MTKHDMTFGSMLILHAEQLLHHTNVASVITVTSSCLLISLCFALDNALVLQQLMVQRMRSKLDRGAASLCWRCLMLLGCLRGSGYAQGMNEANTLHMMSNRLDS